MTTIKRPKIPDTNTIGMDCGCEVEISMVRISADDLKYYRGATLTKLCPNHSLPFQRNDIIEEAIRRYDCKKLEATEQGMFVMKRCPFYQCPNRTECLKNGHVCPAMCLINKEAEKKP